MRPLGFIWLMAVTLAILGVPVAYFIDHDGIMFALTARVEERFIIEAYAWTCVAFIIVVAVAIGLGAHKKQALFLAKPVPVKNQKYYNRAWFSILSLSLIISLVLFVSANFSIPLLELASNPADYLIQRTAARAVINQNLLNINLLFLCPLSACIALFFMKEKRQLKIIVSIVNILLVMSFSLAKSPMAMAVFIIVIFYSCMKPINLVKLAKLGTLLLIIIVPVFIAADPGRSTWGNNRSVLELIGGRVFYGQWAGLPYYFNIYEQKRASIGTLLPSYLRGEDGGRWSYQGEESPSRQAIRGATGYSNLEESGVGVAVTFFIGEAYAAWGYSGVVISSLIVGLQIYLMTLVFSAWPRTIWSMFLYSWFIYKIGIGIITGFSAFLFGSAAYLLFGLLLVTLFTKLHRSLTIPVTPRGAVAEVADARS